MWRRRQRSYHCVVCDWQGMLEPEEPGDAAACPQCGLLLAPQTWGQTWGVVLILVLACVAVVAVAAFVRW